MSETNYFIAFVLISFYSTVISQTQLSSCDYNKYAVSGCEDDLGAECNATTSRCQCKPGYWVVINGRFCFPTKCPRGEYYDLNYGRCEPQRKATLNSEENYCKHDFHCRGDHIHCQHVNEWNYRCLCNQGFVYDTTTQECQRIEGINGFCTVDIDCDASRLRQLVCMSGSCQCRSDFTFNTNIDGCEDNADIAARDSQTRKMMYLLIGLGLFFGAALSLKFGTNSAGATQQLLLKQIIERRQKEREEQRQQKLEEHEMQVHEESVIDLESTDRTDKTENLINNRETA